MSERKGNGLKFKICPQCGQKQCYKNGHVERCRNGKCKLYLIRPPGQDW